MHNYREFLQKKFDQEYANLNEAQRSAVDNIEGPVMVIAGPGTGKTQILAARIGKILLDTDAYPENILCLTYTDAGTIAMRKRLQQFIGADAYKVNIYTFHAFCNDIIQDNLSLFEKNSLDPLSELESIELFKILIDAFPKNHPLKRYRGDVYYEIGPLRNLFSNMKREGWTPEFINQRIDSYINDLPLRDEYIAKRATKEFKKGEVRTDKIDEEKQRMEKLRAAVNEFDNFQQLMRSRNRYDFDDMINWVINAFENNTQLLAGYQEKFQYILVDEYQDTSGTQNKIVQLLINYWEAPNVFVVGDDDQSIYRFQGANVENMLEFQEKFTDDLLKIVLVNNYRSIQPILDISKTLIDRNEERLIKRISGLSKELVSSKAELKGLSNDPILVEYNTGRDEMADITNKIAALLEQGVAPGKIAVIYKENKFGEELATYFSLKKIPYYSKRTVDLFDLPFAKKIIQLLRYLDAETDSKAIYGGDEMLFEILHYDFYNIPAIEIAKITVEVNSKRYSGEQISIRKLLADKSTAPAKDLFSQNIHSGLAAVSNALEKLISDIPNLTLQSLFEKVIEDAFVLRYIMSSPDKIELLETLTALFDFIKSESARNKSLDLHSLVTLLDLMKKEEVKLPLHKVSGTDKGVNLLTAHGSKGLEFEYVFFASVNASFWEKKRKPGGGYKLPDTIFTSGSASSDEEELRRLFYVALTRAEQYLYISYCKFKADGKELEPSMFIAEILQHHALPKQFIQLEPAVLMEYEALRYVHTQPEIQKAEADFIATLLDKFVMNVTALNSYLACPLGFYYKNLIRIPAGKSEATEFGSAIHAALERFFTTMQNDPSNRFPDVQFMIEEFKRYMNKHRENFTQEAFNRRMEYGQEVLTNYYQQYLEHWNKIVAVERVIKGVVVNGVPLKGKLDKLEFTGKEVNVVDYKTGDIDKAKDKLKPPSDKDPNGGDYWRQAVFYKILIDNYEQKDWKVISTEFDFVEPDNNKRYRKEKIVIQPQDTETVKQQIIQVWQKIQERDFYTGCGKEDCHWCNFVKDNNMAVALHEIADQEEAQ